MTKKKDDRLTKLAKRKAIDLREMILYMDTLQPSMFRKSITGYLKRELESINCTGPIISFNMDKSEFLLFQEFVKLTLKEKELLKKDNIEQTEESTVTWEADSVSKEKEFSAKFQPLKII